jgi:hypothetical protein
LFGGRLCQETKWKYFDYTDTLITVDGSGDDMSKFDGNPKNEIFVIPNPSITVPQDLNHRL